MAEIVRPVLRELARLDRSFFARDTLTVARELVGAFIVRKLGRETLLARVVETEAYLADDPACHAFTNRERVLRGEAPRGRSAVLFGEPGTAYVYFNYGMYWLFNVVTEEAGTAGAVLFRSVEPIAGVERMRAHRPQAQRDLELGNGPGKLALALAIGAEFNGRSLLRNRELFLARADAALPRRAIVASPRIGISQARERPWRFHLRDHPCVSKATS